MGHHNTHDAESLKHRFYELGAKKGQLSRQITLAKLSGDPVADMVVRHKAVSNERKALQRLLKKSLNRAFNKWAAPEIEIHTDLSGMQSPILCKHEDIAVEILQDVRGPELEGQWDAFVDGHPAGSLFHLIRIRTFIEETNGHSTNYLCARSEDGTIVGVLPLVQLKSRIFGNFVISVPYFNYGGILAYSSAAARKLVEAAKSWSASLGATHIELRQMGDSMLCLPRRTDKVMFLLPLPHDAQTLWAGFRTKLKAQIRRAQRENLELTIGGAELLDEFHDVFSRNMRRLGTPAYGKAFFAGLLAQLGASAWIVVVKLNGKPAGCAFLTGYKNRMEIPWASTLHEFDSTALNMLMYWEALSFAIAKGYTLFDFGRCTDKAGTYWFKQQWGAQPIPLRWEYCLEEGADLPRLNPGNAKFRLLIAAWQRSPLWLTRLLGPSLVKYLP